MLHRAPFAGRVQLSSFEEAVIRSWRDGNEVQSAVGPDG
jgi:hypothetical protein